MDFVVCGQSYNEFVLGEHMLLFDFVVCGLIIRLCIISILVGCIYICTNDTSCCTQPKLTTTIMSIAMIHVGEFVDGS